MTVEYITVPGWKVSIAECKTFESLPANAKDYITKIEDFLHIPGNKQSFILLSKNYHRILNTHRYITKIKY